MRSFMLTKCVRIDIDDNELLARQFFIRSIPTVVYFKDGKEFNRIVGFTFYKLEIIYKDDNFVSLK